MNLHAVSLYIVASLPVLFFILVWIRIDCLALTGNKKQKSRTWLFVSSMLWYSCILTACNPNERSGNEKVPASNYAIAENWLNLPAKATEAADVFFVYPVCWSRKEGEPPVCDINHPEMRATAEIVFRLQAAAFDSLANVYAPFYRQLDAVSILNETDYALRSCLLDGEPATDITAAFDYYISHYNNGKPFILVGHSEGAMLVKKLLFDHLKNNPAVYKRMIAAYVIGYSVTATELAENPHLHFAQSADDLGVVISYNTEAPDMSTPNPTTENGALVINPISWTNATDTATAEQNAGSFFYEDGGYITRQHLADATINRERGTIVCSTVNPDDYISAYGLFPKGIYHSYDFAFYFCNLRTNAAERITKFLKTIPTP
jgi:pimeloyl-ACP methyl ester carboxylesterase